MTEFKVGVDFKLKQAQEEAHWAFSRQSTSVVQAHWSSLSVVCSSRSVCKQFTPLVSYHLSLSQSRREAMEACAFSRCLLLPRSVPFAKKLSYPCPSLLWFLREGSFASSKFPKPSRVLFPAPCASPSSSSPDPSSSGDLALLFEVEGLDFIIH